MFAGRDYSPFHLYYRKSDGNECICPLGCYNSCEDIFIISFLLMGLWSFLLGCYALLLKAAIDTAESHTALSMITARNRPRDADAVRWRHAEIAPALSPKRVTFAMSRWHVY